MAKFGHVSFDPKTVIVEAQKKNLVLGNYKSYHGNAQRIRMNLAPLLFALFAISLLVMIQATSIITGCGEISASAQTVPGLNTTVKVYYGGTVCLSDAVLVL